MKEFFRLCDYRTIYIPWKAGFGGLTFLSAGYEDFRTRPVDNTYHSRFYYAVHCVLRGSGHVFFRDKEYHLQEGDMFCCPPRERVRYISDEKDPWAYCWFGFAGEAADEYFSSLGFLLTSLRIHRIRNMDQVESIFAQLLRDVSDNATPEMEKNPFAYRLLSSFFAFLEQESLDVLTDVSIMQDRSVSYLEELIRKHYHDSDFSFSGDYLPFQMTSYLRAEFSKQYGMSPMKYLSQLRIQHAATILARGSKKIRIAEVAQMSGYRTTYNFLRAFKSVYGVTPDSYRKLHNTR